MADVCQIIACSVFRDALRHLGGWASGRPLVLRYLPANLHLKPVELKTRLLAAIRQAKRRGDCVGCLYGQCFAGIDDSLQPKGVSRIACDHCYEAFLGRRRYRQIMADQPGTFFVEKAFLLDFDTLCRTPLELDDPDMRDMYFSHYHQVLYIRQPLDPDLTENAQYVADLLKLRLNIVDADYSGIQRYLAHACRCAGS